MNARPADIEGRFGVVSATDGFAARAGMAMLESGGNAFDAAVAAALVMQVVAPHLCGPAGEVTAVFFAREHGSPLVLCGQGPAPHGATPDHLGSLGLGLMPATGVIAAPVPGAFDAWMILLRDYGSKSLEEVFDAAIGYAESGYRCFFDKLINRLADVFRSDWPTSAAIYLPEGRVPDQGMVLRNPDLANTYRRILSEAAAGGGSREHQIEAARRAWYHGFVAEEIEKFAARTYRDPVFGMLPGLIAGSDLAGYSATYEAPAALDWRGWTICKPDIWSQGPVFLQQLALLGDYADLPEDIESAEYIHVLTEAAKLAYADREAFYGDLSDVPVRGLLAPGYARDRRQLIGSTASWEIRPGCPDGRHPRLPALMPRSVADVPAADLAIGDVTRGRRPGISGDTCHVASIDRWGNAITATPSGGFLMSSPAIGSLGFPLSNRLEMTWLEQGVPNCLSPGKRPRTTLSPTLALRDGEPVLAFGTPGADMQEQWSLQFFLAVNAGLSLQAAIDLPKWYTTHLASSLYPHRTSIGEVVVEETMPEMTVSGLKERGHNVHIKMSVLMSRLSAVRRDPATGRMFAAADTRPGPVTATAIAR